MCSPAVSLSHLQQTLFGFGGDDERPRDGRRLEVEDAGGGGLPNNDVVDGTLGVFPYLSEHDESRAYRQHLVQ